MKYDKESLEKMHVYNLRHIARDLGVKAPTTLKRKILIDEIILIQKNEKEPYKKSKKGRPVKNFIQNTNINIETNSIDLKEEAKKEFIETILKEIEKKLYKLL
jgi:hypothetical protein